MRIQLDETDGVVIENRGAVDILVHERPEVQTASDVDQVKLSEDLTFAERHPPTPHAEAIGRA